VISKDFSIRVNGDRLIGVQKVSVVFDSDDLVTAELKIDLEDVCIDTQAREIHLRVLTEDDFPR
jgi:hypothetical protein